MSALYDILAPYGANPAGLLPFDEGDAPGLLPYATLVDSRRAGCRDLAALRGVYEWQESPLVFLVDADDLQDEDHLRRIRRRVALRGDAPYLGIVEPGRLTLHALSLDAVSAAQSRVPLAVAEPILLPYLAAQRPHARHVRRQWVADVILRLLRGSLADLHRAGIHDEDAISLAGRALFTRFLADRELLPHALAAPGEEHLVFEDASRAERTSRWLDETFNGDFLPLSPGLLGRLPPQACKPLGDIMYRAPSGQLHLGWEEQWAYLDFAHIPVGVLSQAYEHYLREHAPHRQRQQGGFYTPRPIAEALVRGAFHALRREGPADGARVLDPAAGAGVFLITAFRELVAERWRHTERRPDTATLREILYQQLTGFDIDEAALRFAALGLYLMSIELDPVPEPVERLRFDNLRGKVLWKVGAVDNPDGSDRVGSLGAAVGPEHKDRYDLVVGNPPWTGAQRIAGWEEVTDNVTRIARARLGKDAPPPPIPNQVQDLPFVWRAMEWARPGGQIALALHARLLFQQGDGMPKAREAIFSALDITGIVNGTELRKTNVWPEVTAPFCLMFARNRVPGPGAGFRFLSPRLERSLNGAGVMRLDPGNAEVVTAHQVRERPTILKTLFRGTRLDLELLERIDAKQLPTLEQYWRQLFGEHRNRPRQAGNGYQRIRESSRTRKSAPNALPGVSASYLHDLREVDRKALEGLLIDPERLEQFDRPRIHDPRSRALFTGPLLIIHKSASSGQSRIQAAVSDTDVIFNESYYGYSASGYSEAPALVRYLAILLGSRFALWHALVSSGEFGFEREVVEMASISSTPIVPLQTLTQRDRKKVDTLFAALASAEDEGRWAEVDAWVATILGLDTIDVQVMEDTLAYNLPFSARQAAAQAISNQESIDHFSQTIEAALSPWGDRLGLAFSITPIHALPSDCPWQVLWLGVTPRGHRPTHRVPRDGWMQVTRVADKVGASEVLQPEPTAGGLWIVRLRQQRYWTQSQARMLAQRIVWDHMDTLIREGVG